MPDTTSYQNIFKDKEYSDIMIKFLGREIPCHKVVICTQSEYFKKLCGKASSFVESKQKVIELKEDDPDAVEGIIRQLYFGSYLSNTTAKDNNWKFHAEVVKAANKYLIPKAAQTASAARMKLLDGLKAANEVYDAIHDIRLYYGEDDALTQKAVELQKKHIKNLLIEPRFVASLTTAEVREHFDRFRKMFGGSLESRGPVCKICGRLCEGNKYGNYVVCDCTGNRVRVSDADYIVIFPTKE